MTNPYDVFVERGFIYQCTDESGLRELFDREMVTAYIGFDATALSFHVGNLVPILALRWLQKTSHRPVAVVGGGTTMIGDPSGKTEARMLLSREDIRNNMEGLKVQLSRFMEFGEDKALMVDNGDWLLELNYIDFLRDIGKHFSVNRMLTAESYKIRLETGLTFIEFNYQILQAYDFLVLFQRINNQLQMGGQDQWGNIVAGTDLIRRVSGGQAYGLTFPLLQDPKTGAKFGKTHKGAVWLDKDMTSPFDFYQFWRNTDDEVLERYLALFTFLPMEEVKALAALEDNMVNRAKEILAYEVTALTHGHEEARQAMLYALQAFGPTDPEGRVETSSKAPCQGEQSGDREMADLPTSQISAGRLKQGIPAPDLFVLTGLTKSKGEARKLIRGGGAYINEERVDTEDRIFHIDDLVDNALILRAGKKRYHRLEVE